MAEKKTQSFRKLDVYGKAYRLSLEIHALSLDFPKHEQYSLADQFRRCTRSICANIAEGYGKQNFSKPEFKRFISMAIGSVAESRVWNDYSRDLGYIAQPIYDNVESEFIAIDKMLRSLHLKITS
jgi:four helix bundle protein